MKFEVPSFFSSLFQPTKQRNFDYDEFFVILENKHCLYSYLDQGFLAQSGK